MCSLYSRALLKELKMNLILKSRKLEVIMAPNSRTLKLKIIVMKSDNEVVKRKNQTLIDMARSILSEYNITDSF
jgi:hypothetical protein